MLGDVVEYNPKRSLTNGDPVELAKAVMEERVRGNMWMERGGVLVPSYYVVPREAE